MALRSERQITRDITRTRETLNRLEEELHRTKNRPLEPSTGSVIKFVVQYGQVGTVYTYVAFRIGNHWYHTGRGGSALTWEDIVSLMSEDWQVREGRRGFEYYLYDGGVWVR